MYENILRILLDFFKEKLRKIKKEETTETK